MYQYHKAEVPFDQNMSHTLFFIWSWGCSPSEPVKGGGENESAESLSRTLTYEICIGIPFTAHSAVVPSRRISK